MHSALFWQLHENTNHKCNKLALAIICIAISLLSCQLCVDFHKQRLNFEKQNGKTELKGHDKWARTSFLLETVVQILFSLFIWKNLWFIIWGFTFYYFLKSENYRYFWQYQAGAGAAWQTTFITSTEIKWFVDRQKINLQQFGLMFQLINQAKRFLWLLLLVFGHLQASPWLFRPDGHFSQFWLKWLTANVIRLINHENNS